MKDEKLFGLCFRGERNLWFDFTNKIKKERKTVWQTLKPMIQDYMKK
ncbi:MAG: hypothetical protein Q8O88_00840 [bacterium]|nr:hypothetical protein [bacterium]